MQALIPGPPVRNPLAHRLIYRDAAAIAVELSLGDELGALGGGVGFPLAEDPRTTSRTSIIGMFVLRPAWRAWSAPIGSGNPSEQLRQVDDWCSNVSGAAGGGTLADGNAFDAMRLALHYGLVDAVIVGSGTVLAEGLPRGGAPGYLWQPHGPAAWPQLSGPAPELVAMIERVRSVWQALGVLSPRRWPAQIVVSQSGAHRPPARDLLEASVFSALQPDGSPVECHILTSTRGAERLRLRAPAHDLGQRIEAMLLPLSPPGDPESIDVAAVPAALRTRLDVRLADHDGGRTVLSRFSAAGALAQLNLTLMRDRAVQDLPSVGALLRGQHAESTSNEPSCELFFSGDHRLPTALRPMQALHDDGEAMVVCFDARRLRGL